ncbi:MAG TPA: hypothetical protein VLL52_12400, partial [Anaerolineae bacterium]|nr:hypothetical protein [Anaerolineae bacterium]
RPPAHLRFAHQQIRTHFYTSSAVDQLPHTPLARGLTTLDQHPAPDVTLITSPQDIPPLTSSLPPEIIDQLHQVDYAQFMAIIAWRGRGPYAGTNLYIPQIDYYDHLLTTYLLLTNQDNQTSIEPAPYLITLVKKPTTNPTWTKNLRHQFVIIPHLKGDYPFTVISQNTTLGNRFISIDTPGILLLTTPAITNHYFPQNTPKINYDTELALAIYASKPEYPPPLESNQLIVTQLIYTNNKLTVYAYLPPLYPNRIRMHMGIQTYQLIRLDKPDDWTPDTPISLIIQNSPIP